MGRIKSALEIALEKTEGVNADKTSVGLFEARQRGKRLANEFIAGETASLEEAIKNAPGEERESIRQGCFDVLVSQITLPALPEDIKKLEAVGRGLTAVIGKRFAPVYQQFNLAVKQYLDEAGQYEEAIKRQYAPKLRQKEEELARRFG
ncbi:MAG: hypothetical protein LBQ44_06165, partial [Treponema sp.]|nr:hypothetical protein [Treponema sp.]